MSAPGNPDNRDKPDSASNLPADNTAPHDGSAGFADERMGAATTGSPGATFAVTQRRRARGDRSGVLSGGTVLGADERRYMLRHGIANPDDPITHMPPKDARGVRPGPDSRGAPGRVAIVQGQVYLVGVLLIFQLFLITTALYELLSGQTGLLWWLALANLVIFLITLLVALWPRQRVRGF